MALSVSLPTRPAAERFVAPELRAFTLWLLDRLEVPYAIIAEGLYQLRLSDEHRSAFENRSTILFTFDAERYDTAAENDLDFAAPGHRFFRWLFEQGLTEGVIEQAAPVDQPENVSEVTARLFPAYKLDSGSVHLAGCSLEDRWVVHPVLKPEQTAQGLAEDELLFTDRCDTLPEDLRCHLRVGNLKVDSPNGQATTAPLSGLAENVPSQIVAGIRHLMIQRQRDNTSNGHASVGAPVATAAESAQNDIENSLSALGQVARFVIIRTRWVSGKLRFSLAGETVDATFSGWAQCLHPPLIECPRTGRKTRHLAATDDDRLAAFESITSCDRTGCRVLESELAQCSLTGQRVLLEFMGRCAVSNAPVLSDALQACPTCQQQVSPAQLTGAYCEGCRNLLSVKKSDARLSLILDEYPRLDSWGRWRLAETETSFIVTAWRGLRRILLVIEKQTMQVRCLAKGGLRRGWTPVDSVEEQAEILGVWD
ncbi:MAG: hypothetical protein MPJ50_12645 [Pirellulales bacterium]|nr:hypothetical protein [Pirellulales bacterium]